MCVVLTSVDRASGFDVDAEGRLADSCSPPLDAVAGYLTPAADADGDERPVGGVDELPLTENTSPIRSRSSLNSLNRRSLVVQTLLRPRTRLAGIFDQAKRRSLGRGGGCVDEMVDGCLTAGIWKPGLHGVARNAGSGGGTKTMLDVDASWPEAAADGRPTDDDDDAAVEDDDETFIPAVVNNKCCFQTTLTIEASVLLPLCTANHH